ncbi:uncharacterized protein [Montipora foliosa]|uniref:uncharacterized protein n=1 Tax=Montipora foliosa TaxID=591990 RepID=UPI0035F1F10A
MNSNKTISSFPSNETSEYQSPDSWVEPSPNWLVAIKEWKLLWHLHVYGFATVFALIAFFAITCIVVSRKAILKKQRAHFAVMNSALVVTGFLRSLVLFWDPYASRENTSSSMVLFCIISWGIGTACITSSFSIVLLIFMETTKTSLGPARLKNLPFLMSITLSNILYLLLSDLVVWFHSEARVMVFICHVTFATWGLVVSIGYSVAGTRMWRNLKASLDGTFFRRTIHQESSRLNRLFTLMCCASFFGVIKFSLSPYTSVGEFGVFADTGYITESWHWFVVQSLLRTLESFLCIFIFLIVFKNRKGIAANHNTPIADPLG